MVNTLSANLLANIRSGRLRRMGITPPSFSRTARKVRHALSGLADSAGVVSHNGCRRSSSRSNISDDPEVEERLRVYCDISRGLGGERVVREEKWRGDVLRRCDEGMALADVQWRGNLAGYANTILSRSSNWNRSQNTVFNSQVLAHSCLSSSGKKSTLGTPVPARYLPLKRRGFGVKKSGVIGAYDCLVMDRLASNSLAVIRVPGIERPAARKEVMTFEDTDS